MPVESHPVKFPPRAGRTLPIANADGVEPPRSRPSLPIANADGVEPPRRPWTPPQTPPPLPRPSAAGWMQRAQSARQQGAGLPALPRGDHLVETLHLAFAQLDAEGRSELRERCMRLRDEAKLQVLQDVLQNPDTELARCVRPGLRAWLVEHFLRLRDTAAFLALPASSPVHEELVRLTQSVLLRGDKEARAQQPGDALEVALLCHWVQHAAGRDAVYLGLMLACGWQAQGLHVLPIVRAACQRLSQDATVSQALLQWVTAHGDDALWQRATVSPISMCPPEEMAPLLAQALAAGDDYVVETLQQRVLGGADRTRALTRAQRMPRALGWDPADHAGSLMDRQASFSVEDAVSPRWRAIRTVLAPEREPFLRACLNQDDVGVRLGLQQEKLAALVRDSNDGDWEDILTALFDAPATLQMFLDSMPAQERSTWVRKNAGLFRQAPSAVVCMMVPYLEGQPAALLVMCQDVLIQAAQRAGMVGFADVMEQASDAQRALLMEALQGMLAKKPSPYAVTFVPPVPKIRGHLPLPVPAKAATPLTQAATPLKQAAAGAEVRATVPAKVAAAAVPIERAVIDLRALAQVAVAGTPETGLWVPVALAPKRAVAVPVPAQATRPAARAVPVPVPVEAPRPAVGAVPVPVPVEAPRPAVGAVPVVVPAQGAEPVLATVPVVLPAQGAEPASAAVPAVVPAPASKPALAAVPAPVGKAARAAESARHLAT